MSESFARLNAFALPPWTFFVRFVLNLTNFLVQQQELSAFGFWVFSFWQGFFNCLALNVSHGNCLAQTNDKKMNQHIAVHELTHSLTHSFMLWVASHFWWCQNTPFMLSTQLGVLCFELLPSRLSHRDCCCNLLHLIRMQWLFYHAEC